MFTKMNQISRVFSMTWLMAKDLAKRTIADKALRDKAFKIASDQKYDG